VREQLGDIYALPGKPLETHRTLVRVLNGPGPSGTRYARAQHVVSSHSCSFVSRFYTFRLLPALPGLEAAPSCEMESRGRLHIIDVDCGCSCSYCCNPPTDATVGNPLKRAEQRLRRKRHCALGRAPDNHRHALSRESPVSGQMPAEDGSKEAVAKGQCSSRHPLRPTRSRASTPTTTTRWYIPVAF